MRRRTLDDDRTVAIVSVYGAQRFAGAPARINVVITIPLIKKTVCHHLIFPYRLTIVSHYLWRRKTRFWLTPSRETG
jgi:hypothetical protein